MIVMPANSTGWLWHALARETGRLGHLYSPRGQCGPWPWFPYALDNGVYACWDKKTGRFNDAKWEVVEAKWHRLIVWAQAANQKPMWAVVPDVPGDAERTIERWLKFAPSMPFPRALAVQDGMAPADVKSMGGPFPDVIAVGGTDDWKWSTVALWARHFPRVHVLRCNAPAKLYDLEALGIESCDGTGWNRGDRKQTAGVEEWARSRARPTTTPLWPYTCRQPRNKEQESFA
jgi:hypothetical protein